MTQQTELSCSDFAEIEDAAALVEHEEIPARDLSVDNKVYGPSGVSVLFNAFHSRGCAQIRRQQFQAELLDDIAF